MNRLYFLIGIALPGAAILIALGVWQMQRLEWKEGILADIDARMTGKPVSLPITPSAESDAYLPVQVSGRFLEGADLRVLVSQKGSGAAYRIISAFDTATGPIMVDRGVMAVDATVPVVTDEVTVIGNLQWPDEIDSFTPDPDKVGNIWYARDVAQMAKELDTAEVLLVARDTNPATPGLTPLPVDTSRIPNNHLQYAITWFSLAVVWLAMTAFFVFRGRRAQTES